MALLHDSVINATKKAADVLGTLNEGQLALMNLLDPQWQNIFEILIYPQDISFSSPMTVLTAALDTVVARLHIQKVSIPFPTIEYEDFNGIKHVSDIKYPDDMTITFLENDLGIVRNYLKYWQNSILDVMDAGIGDEFKRLGATLNRTGSPALNPAMTSTYKFKENQQAAKKNAKIILQMSNGLPSPAGWVLIEGMKLKSIEPWELSQDSQEPMMITATFAVDMVRMQTAMDLPMFG